MRLKYIAWLITTLFIYSVSAENITQVKSPDNSITLDVSVDNNTLFYQVSKQTETIVAKSKLGINTSKGDFTFGVTYETVSTREVNESYNLPSGKRSTYLNLCNEATVVCSKSGTTLQIVFRVYDDGVAFRYEMGGSGNVTVFSEMSECIIPVKDKIYSQTYSKDYKNPFEETTWEWVSCMNTSSLPILVETGYVLLTEAMVNGTYAGAKLSANEVNGAFVYGIGNEVSASLPFKSPWRTLMIGSMETLVESVILDNLNESTSLSDVSWIKPGKAAWNYGGEDTSDYLNMESVEKYIDWADEMNWQYFTLDKGWQRESNLLSRVVNYANSKSVGVFIWVNQTSIPDNEQQMRSMLQGWKNQGVKGLKVDFWESDSQSTMKKYDLLLKIAAEQKLLLNFQSCTKPSGLRKTWPHLLTSEAVMGNVYYARGPEVITSVHNINSAIIRNSLGATDYAPVDFAEKTGRILQGNTWAHQLALSVVFESGVQHIMDSPDNLKYNISKDFLRTLPSAWDDIRCLEARPGEFVSIARRKNEDWYFAALTKQAVTLEVPLSFLPADKKYNAYIYKDGECVSEIAFEFLEDLTSNNKITIDLLEHGGAAVILSTSLSHARPVYRKYEAESANNTIPFGVPVRTDVDSLCSGGKYVASIGKGRSLIFNNITVPETGNYAVTFYYMADSWRTASVKVNGQLNAWHSFINTGKESGAGLAHKTIQVQLNSGVENTIEIGNDSEYAPNLDRIVISRADGTGTNIHETVAMPGKIYVVNGSIVIEQEHYTNYSIHNVLGQQVKTGEFYGGSLTVPLTNGIYIVNISTNGLDFSTKILVP